MPLQNRVSPFNVLEAVPERGMLMGNRGILHDTDKRVGLSNWKHKRWVACMLSFKGRSRVLMAPGRYTELFFLDEAVFLAAGHDLARNAGSSLSSPSWRLGAKRTVSAGLKK